MYECIDDKRISLKAESNKRRTGMTYGATSEKLEFFKTDLLIPLIQKCFRTKGNGQITFALNTIRNYELYGSRHPRKLFEEYFTIEQRAGRAHGGMPWKTKLRMTPNQKIKAICLLAKYNIDLDNVSEILDDQGCITYECESVPSPISNVLYHVIYKITNKITGDFYIGMHSSYNLDDDYYGSGKKIKKSLEYYGKINHKKEILEYCDSREQLAKREAEIVNELFLLDSKCLNVSLGGELQNKCVKQKQN